MRAILVVQKKAVVVQVMQLFRSTDAGIVGRVLYREDVREGSKETFMSVSNMRTWANGGS